MKIFEAKKTLAKAWEITRMNKKKLFWYGFIPSFFSIGVGAIVVYIQFLLFKNSSFFTENPQSIIDIIKPMYFWIISPEVPTKWIVISGILIFLASYFLPIFSQGAIISMILTREKDNTMNRGFKKGCSFFLPLFEFSLLKHSLHPYSLALELIFFARYLGLGSIGFLKILFIIVAPLGAIFLFLFSFVPQYIVAEKKYMGESIVTSIKFVISHLTETIKVMLLLLLIELRVLFNVLIIFLLPILIIAVGGLWAESIFGYIAEGVVFLIVLTLAAMVSGIVFVYGKVTWTITFTELKSITSTSNQSETPTTEQTEQPETSPK